MKDAYTRKIINEKVVPLQTQFCILRDLYEIILLVFNQEKVVLNDVKGRIKGI